MRSVSGLAGPARPSMRRVHRAGEKAFVDCAGQRPTIVDPIAGDVRPVVIGGA